jgi:hypothetical protein
MAYQSIDLGTTAGDGTGDTIRAGGTKLNANFVEVYTLLGTGAALTSGISATATVVTLAGPIVTGFASFQDGTVNAPSITNVGNTNTGIFFSDADAVSVTTGAALRATVNSTGLVIVGNVTATGTVEPAGDTTAGDNAAIGHTSAEGLILTGQGSTNDITVKNDADTDVITIATGTTVVGIPGSLDVEGAIDVNGTSNLDVVDIDGAVDMASTLQVDGAITGSSTIQGTTITATIAFVPDASDGAALGTSALEFSDLFLADEAVISFGDDDDVTLTHVADTGLLLSSTDKLMFNDASQFIQGASATVLDIAATDEIELTSTLVDVVGNLAISGTVVGASTIQGTTITATTAFVPDASDGATLGTSALEFSDLFLADEAVISFGDDDDVTLTHVADTGLLLSSTDQLQFGDSGTYIHQSADGVLDLVSDTELELNATTIDINGNVEISGTTAQVGVATFTARPVFNGGITIGDGDQIGSASDVDAIAIASNGVVTFSQAPVFPDGSINVADIDLDGATEMAAAVVDADLFMIDDGAGGTMKSMLASRLKTYIVSEVGAAADNISGGDAAINLTTSAGNITIDAAGNDTDIILKGTDNNSDTTFLTISGADAGEATFNAGIVIADAGNIGSASDKDAIAIASDGVVTFSQIPVMPANSIDSDEYIDGSIDTEHIGDDQITLAKLAGIARGKIIYGDASGNPAVLAIGSANTVLTADGTDFAWAAAASNAADDIVAGDAAINLTTSSGDITIDAAAANSDIVFRGTTGSTDTTFLTIDGSAAGEATFNAGIVIPNAGNIGSASDKDAIAIASNGVVTFSQIPVIPDNTVTTAKIAASQITTAKIADSQITSAKIADGTIVAADLATDAVTNAKIADNSIDSEHYVDGSIDLVHMSANSVDSNQYVDGSIERVHLAADIIDGTKIANDVLNSEHYAAGSIDREHLAADIIDGTKIANDVLNSEHYAAASIDREHLAADIVDGTKIADNAIGAEHIAANAVGSSEIAANAVTASEIAADAVGASEIAANAVGASEIAASAVGASELNVSGNGTGGVSFLRSDGDGTFTWATPVDTNTDTNTDTGITSVSVATSGSGNVVTGLSVSISGRALTITQTKGTVSASGHSHSGGGGGDECLTYNMKVMLSNNILVNVNNLRVGDNIMTTNGNTIIEELIINHMREGYYVINNELEITNDHPIFVNDTMWKRTEDLLVGDVINNVRIDTMEYISKLTPTVSIITESDNYNVHCDENLYTVHGRYRFIKEQENRIAA